MEEESPTAITIKKIQSEFRYKTMYECIQFCKEAIQTTQDVGCDNVEQGNSRDHIIFGIEMVRNKILEEIDKYEKDANVLEGEE
jgi:hypothetical protein